MNAGLLHRAARETLGLTLLCGLGLFRGLVLNRDNDVVEQLDEIAHVLYEALDKKPDVLIDYTTPVERGRAIIADADARVRIRAPGEVLVERPGRLERRTAHRSLFTLGRGTHSLSLATRQGQVTLPAP